MSVLDEMDASLDPPEPDVDWAEIERRSGGRMASDPPSLHTMPNTSPLDKLRLQIETRNWLESIGRPR